MTFKDAKAALLQQGGYDWCRLEDTLVLELFNM